MCKLDYLTKYAPCAPEINFLVIIFKQDNLWSSIPSCLNSWTHLSLIPFRIDLCYLGLKFNFARRLKTSSHSKVTNFYLTIRVDQNVSWLEITMNNVGTVQIVDPAENVVNQDQGMLLIKFQMFVLE